MGLTSDENRDPRHLPPRQMPACAAPVQTNGTLEMLVAQIADCQAISVAVCRNLQKQREDLDVLTRTQQKLQRSQQDLLTTLSRYVSETTSPTTLATLLQGGATSSSLATVGGGPVNTLGTNGNSKLGGPIGTASSPSFLPSALGLQDFYRASNLGPGDVADGAVTSKLNARKNTALFCVGLPNLVATALRQYATAAANLHSDDGDSPTPQAARPQPSPLSMLTPASDENSSLLTEGKSHRTRQSPRPLPQVFSPNQQPGQAKTTMHIAGIVQNVLSGANWRRAVELMTSLRQVGDQRELAASGQADDEKTVPTNDSSAVETDANNVLQLLRARLASQKAECPDLIGRDDCLIMDILNDEAPTVRVEVILTEPDGFREWERAITFDGHEEIRAALTWASEQCKSLVTGRLSAEKGEWFSHFNEFRSACGELHEASATIKFIPLLSGSCTKDAERYKTICKGSRFYSRWQNALSMNGLWKAEVFVEGKASRAAFQRSVKQAGSYQKALVDCMNWLVAKCKQSDIRQVWFKSRQDSYLLGIAGISAQSDHGQPHGSALSITPPGAKTGNINSEPELKSPLTQMYEHPPSSSSEGRKRSRRSLDTCRGDESKKRKQ